MTLKVKNIII